MPDLETPQSPSGDGADQRTGVDPALSNNLLEKVLDRNNLRRAWKQVRANNGAPGVDGVSVKDFRELTRDRWPEIYQALIEGSYQPQPVRRVQIEKEDGGYRLLGVPTVLDRWLQQAIVQVLTPLIDPSFSEYSYGFRRCRSAHDAVRRVLEAIKGGRKIAVDVDLSKFFDRVNHDFLMSLLGKKIQDKALLRLIGRFLRAGIDDHGTFLESREGVPQGGPLSPLLSNIVLDLLDKELERRGHQFARYADDFIILVKSQRAGERVMASITRYVEQHLKLKVNDHKSQVVPASRCKFLGFCFKQNRIIWHDKALQKFKREVRRLTARSWGVSMETKIRKLNQYLRGWINYYGIASHYNLTVELDHWIRRRIRMCYWKQWRKPRTKIRNLIKLGVPVKLAISCGMTSKGYWHSARTEGIQKGLTNQWLEQQGLVSLRDRWVALHYG